MSTKCSTYSLGGIPFFGTLYSQLGNILFPVREQSIPTLGPKRHHVMLRGIPLMIQSLEKVRRNEILITAKAMGAGLRQLSRLTGVSFGVIQKL